jgi:hypothetical protein
VKLEKDPIDLFFDALDKRDPLAAFIAIIAPYVLLLILVTALFRLAG